MDKIKVNKSELLRVLRANRAKHREIFEKALVGFQTKWVATLERKLADARAGKRIRPHISMTFPIDQTGDYDRAIAMLDMSVEDQIVLSETDFQQYVQDEWRWKGQFSATNKLYAPESFADDEDDADSDGGGVL